MPTVLCVDCSFSMYQSASIDDESINKLELAQTACSQIIAYLLNKFKLEHIAILSFSSEVQEICGFSRDSNLLLASLSKITFGDKSSIDVLSKFINNFVQKEWGCMQLCNIIVVSDGRLSMNQDFLNASSLNTITDGRQTAEASSVFDFDCQFHFVCIETMAALKSSGCWQSLQEIVRKAGGCGSIQALHISTTVSDSIKATTAKFLEDCFKIFEMVLQCGNLKSKVFLYPPPHTLENDNECNPVPILEILGFLSIPDVGNPPVISRHMVLPIADETAPNGADAAAKNDPCFSVLLHGSLKKDNKVAFARVASDWYGVVSFWADSKNKSNLVLSLLSRGHDTVPWLGGFRMLGPASLLPSDKRAAPDLPTFPVHKKGIKRSYAQSTVAWTRPTGLQTDVQKILRSAKKLPEKSQVFYKELNRLRRAALAFGFHDLLEGISSLLERECTLLPGTAHPEATLQLSHAAQELRASIALGYEHTLVPLKTDFKFHGGKS